MSDTPPSASGAPLAAVLAGGRGTRIGGAKAGVRLAGRPLIDYALAATRSAGLETVVLAKRGSELPPIGARVVGEPAAPAHPLCGVLAALRYAQERVPGRAVVVLPCDMPFLTGASLRRLADADGAAVFANGSSIEPLPARLEQAHVAVLREALARESSLREALRRTSPQIFELDAASEPERLLLGINDREQLARAERILTDVRPGR